MLSVSFLLWSSASLLTPSDGRRTTALYWCRTLVGTAMGVVFPSIHSILVRWIPMHERSRAVSLFTSGMYFGSAFGMLVLPRIITAYGPDKVPLAIGVTGLCWLVLWSQYAKKQPPGGSVAGGCARAAGALFRRLTRFAAPCYLAQLAARRRRMCLG